MARIARPVQFVSASNYAAFMTRIEVRIYRATDVDRVKLLATDPAAVEQHEATPRGTAPWMPPSNCVKAMT